MTYTIRCFKTGEIIANNATFREAGHILLTHGGHEYEIRKGADIFAYVLWRKMPHMKQKVEFTENKTVVSTFMVNEWFPTKIDTMEVDPDKAVNEILRVIVQNHGWFTDCILHEDNSHVEF